MQIISLCSDALDNLTKHFSRLYLNTINLYNVYLCLFSLNNKIAAWLPAFLTEKEAGGTQWARCAEPLNVQGSHVRELLPHILQCPSIITYKNENETCEFVNHQCPEGCKCMDITVKPRMHANSESVFRPDEFGLISGGFSVDCSSLELMDIPDNLPLNTKELNLRNNLIKSITIDSGLFKLKNLETL
ncbi:unnamed protein product [Heterobilharzia americana]|nr:unnamed protein product [Heterobilharzia americana]